jgi:DNA-directed RNA polymerase subunit K/omega
LKAPQPEGASDLRALGRGQAAGDGFYVVTLMFHRQRQLKEGARPRVDARGHSSTRVAVLEVLAGLVVATA